MNRALAPLVKQLEPEDETIGAKLGVIEAVRAGATTVCEYATGVEELVEAVYDPFGVRVVASETINEIADERDELGAKELPSFDRSQGSAALDRTEQLFDRYKTHDRVTVTYAPQAVDMVSEETLREVARRSAEHDRDVHIHVAQGERERLQVEQRYGSDQSAVSLLAEFGLLNDRLLAAHLHGATGDERARLATAGARMVGCPGSIGMIDGKVPPVLEYVEQGGVAGLGTDQAPGTGRHDVLREARAAALLTKTERNDPRALPAWQALRMATIGGARALGIDDRVGTIEVGKRADLAIVDLDTNAMTPAVDSPFRTAVPNLIHGSVGTAVRSTMVGGEFVVRDGTFLPADERKIREQARKRAERVFEESAADWWRAGSKLAHDADAGRL